MTRRMKAAAFLSIKKRLIAEQMMRVGEVKKERKEEFTNGQEDKRAYVSVYFNDYCFSF